MFFLVPRCCICGKVLNGYGNNPQGARVRYEDGRVVTEWKDEDRCCDDCNWNHVIPGRLRKGITRVVKVFEE